MRIVYKKKTYIGPGVTPRCPTPDLRAFKDATAALASLDAREITDEAPRLCVCRRWHNHPLTDAVKARKAGRALFAELNAEDDAKRAAAKKTPPPQKRSNAKRNPR